MLVKGAIILQGCFICTGEIVQFRGKPEVGNRPFLQKNLKHIKADIILCIVYFRIVFNQRWPAKCVKFCISILTSFSDLPPVELHKYTYAYNHQFR